MNQVSIVSNPLKTVLVEGSFKISRNSKSVKFTLKTRLALDYLDVRIGTWIVALKDILVVRKTRNSTNLKQSVNVSINLVDGKCICKEGGVQNCYPPIQRFEINFNVNAEKLTTFNELLWFTVNCPTTMVDLYFDFWPEFVSTADYGDFEVTATLLFRRIQ
jgi:hypothetical protein